MSYAPRTRVWSVAALATPCVTISDARAHLRVTDLGEDAGISAMLLAAQTHVERYTQRLLTRRAATLWLPGLPAGACPVELPGGEVGTITSVTVDGAALAGATAYGDSPAVLTPESDWPAVQGATYPVQIVYQAGFADCPMDLQYAVLLIAADLYARRANSEEGALSVVPTSAEALMGSWRIRPA